MNDAMTLEVEGLKTHFFTKAGVIRAVDDVSFSLRAGEVMGLVGESGSGKSVTGFSILGLVDSPGRVVDGRINLQGRGPARLRRGAKAGAARLGDRCSIPGPPYDAQPCPPC